ncbi:hypothetical protein HZS_2402 [Henneguya salminicola]|nr:hypothetical protein HZS_2402 [Henneguya salminicola]
MVIWITEEYLSLLRHTNHTFINATFRFVPHLFSQYLIVMISDLGTNEYVTCLYPLLIGKWK